MFECSCCKCWADEVWKCYPLNDVLVFAHKVFCVCLFFVLFVLFCLLVCFDLVKEGYFWKKNIVLARGRAYFGAILATFDTWPTLFANPGSGPACFSTNLGITFQKRYLKVCEIRVFLNFQKASVLPLTSRPFSFLTNHYNRIMLCLCMWNVYMGQSMLYITIQLNSI